jgi:hypothetical protein
MNKLTKFCKVVVEMRNDLYPDESIPEVMKIIVGGTCILLGIIGGLGLSLITIFWIVGWGIMSMTGQIAYVYDLNDVMNCGAMHFVLMVFAAVGSTACIQGKRNFVRYYHRMAKRIDFRESSV